MAKAEPATRPRILDGVQYLRGLAALAVVIGHENGLMGFKRYFGAMPLPSVQEAALFAVAVFFVVSGFIIVVTSLDERGAPAVGRQEFARRRAVRILPFLWLCTIGYNLLSWAGTGVFDWTATARTLVLSPVGELKPNVAWSLRHELLFYLMFAATMLGRRHLRWLMAVWVAIVPVLFVVVHDLSLVPPRPDDMGFELFGVTLMGSDIGAHLQFGVGMALGLAHRRRALRIRGSATTMLAVLMALSALVVAVPLVPGLARVVLWSAAAGWVVWLAIVARPWPGAAGRGAMLLGNASFAVYLIHNPVMLVVLAAAGALGVHPVGTVALALFLLGAVLLSLIAGIVAHLLVERPLIRWIDRRTRPARTGPPVAPIADAA